MLGCHRNHFKDDSLGRWELSAQLCEIGVRSVGMIVSFVNDHGCDLNEYSTRPEFEFEVERRPARTFEHRLTFHAGAATAAVVHG